MSTDGRWWLPDDLRQESVNVNGITFAPGDHVICRKEDGRPPRVRRFLGWSPLGQVEGVQVRAFWMNDPPSTAPDWQGAGPYFNMEPVNLLESFVKEIAEQ